MLDIHAKMLFLAARVRTPSDAGKSPDHIRNSAFRTPEAHERVRLVAPPDHITHQR